MATPESGRLLPTDPVSRLSGVGPGRTLQLATAGVRTVGDLLFVLPFRWEDRRRISTAISLTEPKDGVLVRGRVLALKTRRIRRRGVCLSEGIFEDDTGRIPVIWFHSSWAGRQSDEGKVVDLYGSVRNSRVGKLQLVNPEVVQPGGPESRKLVPIYPGLGGLGAKMVRRLVRQALDAIGFLEDPLPEEIRRRSGLPGLESSLVSVHEPAEDLRDDQVAALAARTSTGHLRLAFDEMLAFSLRLAEIREKRGRGTSPVCVVNDEMRRRAMDVLPFRLTSAQQRVVREISGDLLSDRPMARLLQGDVGSGKTVVAALAMLIALENGHQVALMAPTQLLARQHADRLTKLFTDTPWSPVLLTGSLRDGDRRDIAEGLAVGRHSFIVGTHALIQETLEFANLGLVVIDEQHRFGTAQREALARKGEQPHLLVMTATPIPRSLALTVYGDLDVSVIDELPPGRTPVRTEIRHEEARPRVIDFLRAEIGSGGRVYIVFPLIEASNRLEARALEQHVEGMRAALGESEIAVLHGRLTAAEKEAAYEDFRSGKVKVLAATTVVEVGIDVAEASVMVIESPHRFGLSQLHQLRGRVGRGERKSWCILMVEDDAAEKAMTRMRLLAETTDGFEIAEADLKMRGPGDLGGTRQWGPAHFRFVDFALHAHLVEDARTASRFLAESGRLESVRSALARYHRTEFEPPAG